MGHQPYDYAAAHDAAAKASRAQHSAEEFLREAYRMFAQSEEAYRVALATRIVELRAEGTAATLCADLARGERDVAALRRARDIAEGVKEAAAQAAWRRAADRKDTQRFVDWSMRRDLAEGYGNAPEPPDSNVIGGQRAA
jgi:hypothetical protein